MTVASRLMPELVERIDGFQAQGFAFNVDVVKHDSLDGNKPRIIPQAAQTWVYASQIEGSFGIRDQSPAPAG